MQIYDKQTNHLFFVYSTVGLIETQVLRTNVLFLVYVLYRIAVPYSMDEFAWTRQQAILINGIIGGVSAVLMAFYFITIAYISKWYAVNLHFFITQPCIFPQGAVQDNDHDWFVYHRICIFAVYSNEQYIS